MTFKTLYRNKISDFMDTIYFKYCVYYVIIIKRILIYKMVMTCMKAVVVDLLLTNLQGGLEVVAAISANIATP